MHWATILGAVCSLTAVSAQDDTYSPGVPPSPFPSAAAAARLKIDPQTACDTANNASKPRNVQLAAWVECQILAFYPYPRGDDPANTDWIAGYEDTFHPSARLSFNGTRFNRDGFLQLYKTFSSSIGQNFAQFQQFRDYYVASPDSWNATSIGGTVSAQGFNGGIFRNGITLHAPNAAFITVEEREGRRWITELREQSTLMSASQLPKDGQLWPCNPEYEVCS
ncbi:hypothetical protein DM02DRAFT_651734 [Periconia macrospinosa]|uniref:Uncharacterized protein n=1 Tax=Periconia macrospinosa TaxID=97972 RepID=A0A2V1E215_9PLEO|nr:hypothetical protein DM02DRAFT_651734 [Periconia macrospinosa]